MNASPHLTPASFAAALAAGDAAIHRAYRAGSGVSHLVKMRANLVDSLLRQAWQQHANKQQSACLIAVGGYGRGELHPHSDIDLLLLTDATPDSKTTEALANVIRFLWDAHLDISHSLRTPDECVTAASDDLSVATNLMETRLLAGDAALYETMHSQLDQAGSWPVEKFFQAKLREQQQRHLKYHDTAYKLEPNIKESPGGLRDIQTIAWIANRHFKAKSLIDLETLGFLNQRELQVVQQAQDFLWKVRYLLHHFTGRKEDRLLFDLQRNLAHAFGYLDDTNNLAIEQFMQRYYRTVMRLQRLNEMLLQLLKEAILHAQSNSDILQLNDRFIVRNGFLDVINQDIFRQQPETIFEVFLLLAKHPEIEDVSARTIRLIRDNLHVIDTHCRNNQQANQAFIDIWRQPRGLTHNLRRMNRYGVLAAYLPVFERIVGRMQYDLFHVYTVDEHSIFVVRNLRRMMLSQHKHELPLCWQIATQIPKPELLYIAGFFHDIAKGRGGDHSQLGAEEANEFCLQHHISSEDTRLITWLVQNHLLMSTTAQRKDLTDPRVIHQFAMSVRNTNTLNHLYLLTVADIRGTNPDLWNGWKDSLLKDLYSKTSRALARGLNNPIDEQERAAEIRADAITLIAAQGINVEAIQQAWQDFDLQYFLRHSADEIAWHTKAILQDTINNKPLVLARHETERGASEIFIFTPDNDHLFAAVTAILGRLGTDIVDARITTTETGLALDTFLILENTGEAINDAVRLEDIRRSLQKALENPKQLPSISTRRTPRELQHFNVPLQVRYLSDYQGPHTALEIIANDRPGLLARIGRAFVRHNIHVHSARIITIGERAEDIFVISKQKNHSLINSSELIELTHSLSKELETNPT